MLRLVESPFRCPSRKNGFKGRKLAEWKLFEHLELLREFGFGIILTPDPDETINEAAMVVSHAGYVGAEQEEANRVALSECYYEHNP